jgi:hypothetical protein
VKQLYTLLESPTFLQLPELYKSLGVEETRFHTARQLNKAITKTAPDLVLAEFFYGFGNNYAGINISNLDVSLHALQRHAPQAKVMVLADKADRPYVPKLEALFKIDAILTLPVTASDIKTAISGLYKKPTGGGF